jgi:hypothetical protein
MDLDSGFKIEDPPITVPFLIGEDELRKLVGSRLRHVTTGYFTVSCCSLGGLEHELGFHFEPRSGGRLVELEFFRRAYPDQAQSFAEFQKHFEREFGEPARTVDGPEGLPSHVWELGRFAIVHCVYDRFGPEEHMRIRIDPLPQYIGWYGRAAAG